MKETIKDYGLVALKGAAMGAADVVPGVSGGTIAFITGIYERLIDAIKNVNLNNIKLLFKGRVKDFWRNIDGTFLFFLIAGIGASFISLARLMTYLLENHQVLVWSFFTGLVFASTIFVGRDVKWNAKSVAAFIAFTALSFFITSPENQPIDSTGALWYIFVCGAIAICAMILPGISGSFVLLLLGKYFYMMKALSEFDLAVIFVFIAGAFIGITSFSHALSWLFKHCKNMTLAALAGFMFGSMNKIWAWKETLSTYTDAHGVVRPLTERNILPASYEQVTGDDPQILAAALLAVFGFVLIFAIELIAKKMREE